MTQKARAACSLFGLIGAAYAIIDENVDTIEEVFGEELAAPLRTFLEAIEDSSGDFKAAIDRLDEEAEE